MTTMPLTTLFFVMYLYYLVMFVAYVGIAFLTSVKFILQRLKNCGPKNRHKLQKLNKIALLKVGLALAPPKTA